MISKKLIERLEQEKQQFYEIEEKLADPAISTDPLLLKKTTQEHAKLDSKVKEISSYLNLYKEWKETVKLCEDEKDAEIKSLAETEANELAKTIQSKKKPIELLLIPPDFNEGRNVFLEIRAGTGGNEAALFVSDLMRMYLRFAEKKSLKTEIIHSSPTELGGYKEVIFLIEGKDAYSLLHQEGGAHRVQRIPVTESNGRLHTSAVTVVVLAEQEESEVEINESDLKIDVFRASGAGGQHVNKTESAIRITHRASGLVVSCQDERSQHKNKARAMAVLRSRLAERQEQELHLQENNLKREQIKSGDRSERIRTYNFPQGRVTDHRISYTAYNLESLMNGDMSELIDALIHAEREEKLQLIR